MSYGGRTSVRWWTTGPRRPAATADRGQEPDAGFRPYGCYIGLRTAAGVKGSRPNSPAHVCRSPLTYNSETLLVVFKLSIYVQNFVCINRSIETTKKRFRHFTGASN